MILQRLIEYQKRQESTPTMYVDTNIHWFIELDSSGNFINMVGTDAGESKGKPRPKKYLVPSLVRSMGVRALLLVGNGEYVLGVAREKSKPERVAECFKSFIELINKCAEKTSEPSVKAIQRFLKNNPKEKMKLHEDFIPEHNLSFRVDGKMPFDFPSVQTFWADYTSIGGDEMQCILCGEMRTPSKVIPVQIKGIPGGQPTGMAVISANSKAFESYGLKKSLIAPTCQQCGERFSKALNSLLASPANCLRVGKLKYIFWTKEEHSFSFNIISDPKPEEVKNLIKSFYKARDFDPDFDPMPFYSAAVSASGGRVVFRDWIDTTVGNVQRNLARFFVLQGIADSEGIKHFGITSLASATVRDLKELPTQVPKNLVSFALRGGKLPFWLMNMALNRCKAEKKDKKLSRNRASLIKMVYLSNLKQIPKEDYMVNLEKENTNPAYICGRLLAILDSIQFFAIGDVGANVVDRYYGTASSAPASVFGNLMRGAQSHLSKIRKEKRGLQVNLQKQLAEVAGHLVEFPSTLNMKEQGLFALGYYHQRAERGKSSDAPEESDSNSDVNNQKRLNSEGE